MIEKLDQPNLGARYLAEARMQTFSESDPYVRGQMLAAGLLEGDLAMNGTYPWDAYADIGVEIGRDPYTHYPLAKKLYLGGVLVESLAKVGQFESAYELAQNMELFSAYEGLTAYCNLLQHGYSGPNQKLLYIYDANYLYHSAQTSDDPGREQFQAEVFLTALAEHGFDLSEAGTPQNDLLTALSELEPDSWQRQRQFKRLASAYAEYAGNIPLAFKFLDKVRQHDLRAEALIDISEHIEKARNP